MSPPRILLSGDVLGRLSLLYKRFSTVNKSAGPFDALLCVGQFFPEAVEQLEEFMAYIEGRVDIPIRTYFIGDYGVGGPKVLSAAVKDEGSSGFQMDGLKVCHNLYWLKGGGKFTLHGLSVAYLSGRKSPSIQPFGTYTQDDVDALRALAEEPGIIDFFLTNEWPSGITNRISASDQPSGVSNSPCNDSIVAELVAEIKPRYHIAGSKGVFYAREPYCNVDAVHVTRFFGLAPVGNKDKQKFMHAISPTPSSTMSPSAISMQPPNTTLSPYNIVGSKETGKRPAESTPEVQLWCYDVKKRTHGERDTGKLCFKFLSSGSCQRGENCHFRHDAEAKKQYVRGVCFDFLNKGQCERGLECQFRHDLVNEGEIISRKRPRSETASAGRSKECWFCLSSPILESHLIISVGENIYCALAKGPLVDDHVLVIPVEHFPSTLSLPPEFHKDLCRFQNRLHMFCKAQGKQIIFFEWITKRGNHANLQSIPIPLAKASAVKNIFNLAAKKLGFEFDTMKNDDGHWRAQYKDRSGFFYVELPDGTVMGHAVDENEDFPFQFGREVLAGLLQIPDKADWRNCQLSEEEEVKMAEAFKSRFKAFDPSEEV